MHAHENYPRVAAALELVANWLKRRQAHQHSLDGLPNAEVQKIAHDMGLSTADLRALDRLADQPLLLPRLLEALHIDPEAVARSEPMVYRDLQRVCAMCDSKKRCARDLKEGTAAVHFEDYCPNTLTLKTLS
jgi:hypothetical protein